MTAFKPENVILVAFGGPSSSGKTTVAKTLAALLPHVTLIHQDDFYLADSQIPIDKASGYQDWDCPEALNFDKFKKYLTVLKNGEGEPPIDSIQPDDLDLKLLSNGIEAIKTIVKEHETKFNNGKQKHIYFIDGFMLFHDPEITNLFDVKLFFHASFATLKRRREARSGYNTVEGFWTDPPEYFEKIVWPAFESSHKYLFTNNDVEGQLNPKVAAQYKIHDVKNEDGCKLIDLVTSALNIIIHEI